MPFFPGYLFARVGLGVGRLGADLVDARGVPGCWARRAGTGGRSG
jgi:hypothetical protein